MNRRFIHLAPFWALLLVLAACAPSTSQPTDDPSLPFQSTRGPLEGDAETIVQILHASDQEGAVAALEDAPRFSSVINGLRDDYDLTMILSSGDLYIPGPFFSATSGSADIRINNAVGTQGRRLRQPRVRPRHGHGRRTHRRRRRGRLPRHDLPVPQHQSGL